jgi:hypothetical protein
MRHFQALLGCALACWLAFGAAGVRADDINWSYTWSGPAGVGNSVGGGVAFIPVAGTGANTVDGKPAFMLEAFGPAGPITNGVYHLTMHLKDTASGQTADLPFNGVLNGPAALGLVNQFTSPLANQVTLGGNNYGVIIGLFSPPGPTGTGVQGVIGTNIMVVPTGGQGQQPPPPPGPPVKNVPEPSTLVLAGLGLSALAVRLGWRRRRGVAMA